MIFLNDPEYSWKFQKIPEYSLLYATLNLSDFIAGIGNDFQLF